ncbi:MAG TPA: dihydroorotase [Candidatus Limnocylindrales bacterium]|nr:dihydroorotase [Candidatus Limnocylindrales bacterium]
MQLHGVRVLDATGLSEPRSYEVAGVPGDDRSLEGVIVSPGWTDLHVHLRDPGFPQKETIATGARAAAAGGFSQLVAMANTSPVTDDAALVRAQYERADSAPVRIAFAAALTVGLQGRELTNAAALRAAGAVALSDDGRHAMDQATLRRGLEQAAQAGLPVFVHAQDERLGMSRSAENQATAEVLETLAAVPEARLHLQHVSTVEAVAMVASARQDGLRVTAEVTPHHLTLTEEDARRTGPLAKVNPPLRTDADREALRHALIDGVIDVIATDHAPHELAVKTSWDQGAPGISGLETALPVILSLALPWPVVYRAFVAGPRAILGIPSADDVILIDPDREWRVDPEQFHSLGRNTPLDGRPMRGAVRMTICRGRVVYGARVPVG